MNPIEEIKKKAEKYPELVVQKEEAHISILPKDENGFEVWFSDDGDEYTVGYGPWHEHFEKDDVQNALNCFAFGLSKECRLKVFSIAGNEYKWVMESLENNEWVQYSTMGLFNFSFWCKKEVKYLSNDVL